MTAPFQRLEVNISNAPDFDVIQRQVPLDMNRATANVEVGLAEITGFSVQPDAQLSAASGLGEFDMRVIAVDRLLEQLDRLFRTQADFHRMVTLAKPVDKAFFPWPVRVWWRWKRRRIFRHLLHLLPQAKWPHVRPYFLDESQALGFGSDYADILPAQRNLLVFRPDRVLLFVIHHDLVDGCIFFIRIVPTHFITSVIVSLQRFSDA